MKTYQQQTYARSRSSKIKSMNGLCHVTNHEHNGKHWCSRGFVQQRTNIVLQNGYSQDVSVVAMLEQATTCQNLRVKPCKTTCIHSLSESCFQTLSSRLYRFSHIPSHNIGYLVERPEHFRKLQKGAQWGKNRPHFPSIFRQRIGTQFQKLTFFLWAWRW